VSVIELKRKARKKFGPQPGFTVDSDWNLVKVERRVPSKTGRPFGSHRLIPFGKFGLAREMASGKVKQEYIKTVLHRDPDLADNISLHLEEPSEREIAHAMGLCNRVCKDIEVRTKCVPNDTYARYMRELRRQSRSSNKKRS